MSKLVQDATGNDLTYRIIGAAMAVHNNLGHGYKEEIYERALAVELRRQNVGVQEQFPVEIYHEGAAVGLFYLDLFVEGVVVEVKALSHQLTNDEVAQVLNYLKATSTPVGLLFNFGRHRLEFKRIFPSRGSGPVQRVGRHNVKKQHLSLDQAPEAG